MLSKLFRVVTASTSKNKCSLIFINQTRSSMDKYKPEEGTGGKALRFYASQRIRFNKVKPDLLKPEEGMKINCSVLKNRCITGENPYKTCSYYVRYGLGIDNVITMPILLDKYNLITKKGHWYRLEDESGECITLHGVLCKWNGINAFLKSLYENNELLKEFEEMLSEAMIKDNKSNSVSNEEAEKLKQEDKTEEDISEILDK